ncbi:MAG: vWA domain-containing protein [Planctomycetota bacterium]
MFLKTLHSVAFCTLSVALVLAFAPLFVAQEKPDGRETPKSSDGGTGERALDIIFMVDNSNSISWNDAGDMRIDMMKALVDFYALTPRKGSYDRFSLIQFTGREESEREGRKVLWREPKGATTPALVDGLKKDIESLYSVPWGKTMDISVAFDRGLRLILDEKAAGREKYASLPDDVRSTTPVETLPAFNPLWAIVMTDGVTEVFSGADTPRNYIDLAKKFCAGDPSIPPTQQALFDALAVERGFDARVDEDDIAPEQINAAADAVINAVVKEGYSLPGLKYTPISLSPGAQIRAGVLSDLALKFSDPTGRVINTTGRAFRDIFLPLLELRPTGTRPSIYDYQYDVVAPGESATHQANVFPGNIRTRIVVFCTQMNENETPLNEAPVFDVVLLKDGQPVNAPVSGSGRYRIFNLDALGAKGQGAYRVKVTNTFSGGETGDVRRLGFESTVFSEFDLSSVAEVIHHDDFSAPLQVELKLTRADDKDEKPVFDPELVGLLDANIVMLRGKLDAETIEDIADDLADYLYQPFDSNGVRQAARPGGYDFMVDKPIALDKTKPVRHIESLPIAPFESGWRTILFTVQGIEKVYLEANEVKPAGKALRRVEIVHWYQAPIMDIAFAPDPASASIKDRLINGESLRVGFGNVQARVFLKGRFAFPPDGGLPDRALVPIASLSGTGVMTGRLQALMVRNPGDASSGGDYNGELGIVIDKTVALDLGATAGGLCRLQVNPDSTLARDSDGKLIEESAGVWRVLPLSFFNVETAAAARPWKTPPFDNAANLFEIKPLALTLTMSAPDALILAPLSIRADVEGTVSNPSLLPDTIRVPIKHSKTGKTVELVFAIHSARLPDSSASVPRFKAHYICDSSNAANRLDTVGDWLIPSVGVNDKPLSGWFSIDDAQPRRIAVRPRKFSVAGGPFTFDVPYIEATTARPAWDAPFALKRKATLHLEMLPKEPPLTVTIDWQPKSQPSPESDAAAQKASVLFNLPTGPSKTMDISSSTVDVELIIATATNDVLAEDLGSIRLSTIVSEPSDAGVALRFPDKTIKLFMKYLPFIIGALVLLIIILYFVSVPSWAEQQYRTVLQGQPLSDVVMLSSVKRGFEKRVAGLIHPTVGELCVFKLTGRKLFGTPHIQFIPTRPDAIFHIRGNAIVEPYRIQHGDEILIEARAFSDSDIGDAGIEELVLRYRYFEHQPTPEEISSDAAPTFAEDDIIIEGF